jgi:hypothetical protein
LENEQDVLRRQVQALAKQSDRFLRHGGGDFRWPAFGDDDLDDHEAIGSVRCVVGKAGIHLKVIRVDFKKAVEAIIPVKARGHLGFQHGLRQLGFVGGADAAPDGEGYKRHYKSPQFRLSMALVRYVHQQSSHPNLI